VAKSTLAKRLGKSERTAATTALDASKKPSRDPTLLREAARVKRRDR